jgi:hypothetical protein
MHRDNGLRCVECPAHAFRDSLASSKLPSNIPCGQTRSRSRPMHGRAVQTCGLSSPALPHALERLEYICLDGWSRSCSLACCVSTPAIIPSRHGGAKESAASASCVSPSGRSACSSSCDQREHNKSLETDGPQRTFLGYSWLFPLWAAAQAWR